MLLLSEQQPDPCSKPCDAARATPTDGRDCMRDDIAKEPLPLFEQQPDLSASQAMLHAPPQLGGRNLCAITLAKVPLSSSPIAINAMCCTRRLNRRERLYAQKL